MNIDWGSFGLGMVGLVVLVYGASFISLIFGLIFRCENCTCKKCMERKFGK